MTGENITVTFQIMVKNGVIYIIDFSKPKQASNEEVEVNSFYTGNDDQEYISSFIS